MILAGKVGSILGAESQNEAMNMGYKIFAAGLCCGLSCLGSGFAIGITGDAGVRGVGQQGKPGFIVRVFVLVSCFVFSIFLFPLACVFS